ncbi:MAG: succinylglutamate desuccinylase/aspartoacylase family protein [Candidatus Nanohalobium sp.]
MRVEKRGTGEPEYSIVGGIHGDEPAGRKAIERILAEDLRFERPVQFVVANEEALAEDKRFLDDDLNRVFPGDSGSDSHEKSLAVEILKQVKGTKVLDLHTTHSYPYPFSTFSSFDQKHWNLLSSAGVLNAVLFDDSSGSLHSAVDQGIIVEAGHQGTAQAVENAVGVVKNFLSSEGVLDLDYHRSEPNIFRYCETVEGDWKFTGENFRKIRAGEVFAEKDGEKLVAEEEFYPVLMSTNGYRDKLGFKAEKIEGLKD